MTKSHEHRPGWLIVTYAKPRGNRTQIGYRNNPVMICRICGKRIVQQSCPSRLVGVWCISFLLAMFVTLWFALQWNQPLLLLLLVPVFFGGHYAVYKRTTFVLMKYHKRHKQ